MKKNTSTKLAKRLAKYGALSAAVLGVADASGQVTYTDVSPDLVLELGEVFDVDLQERFQKETFKFLILQILPVVLLL